MPRKQTIRIAVVALAAVAAWRLIVPRLPGVPGQVKGLV